MSISDAFTIMGSSSKNVFSLNGDGDICFGDNNTYKRALLIEKYKKPKTYTVAALYEFLKETLRNEEAQQFPIEINDVI